MGPPHQTKLAKCADSYNQPSTERGEGGGSLAKKNERKEAYIERRQKQKKRRN
jgi:hypothetical protein